MAAALKPMPRCFALVLLAVMTIGAAPISPWANLADPVFERIGARALPEPYVISLAQGAEGFLWVGTAGGLARFDGYRFKNYLADPTNPHALPDGQIVAIAPDSGGLWLGTLSSSLVRFDAATEAFRTWRADPNGRTGPRSATINALVEAPDHRLWIGGDAGLDRFDPRSGAFERWNLSHADDRQPEVGRILIDKRGGVWVGTTIGLYYRAKGASTFRAFDVNVPAGAGPHVISSLYEDHEGRLWVGSRNVVYVFDRNRRFETMFSASPGDPATLAVGSEDAIIEASPGNFWVGSSESAISIVDLATHRVRRVTPDPINPAGFATGGFTQFLRDRSGLIWVAADNGGLLLHNPLSRGMYVLSASRANIGLNDAGATAVAVAQDGRLWVGSNGGSLVELDPRSGRRTRLILPSHDSVRGLSVDGDGTLWIASLQLCALRAHQRVPDCPVGPRVPENARVWVSLVADGTLWVGTSAGLFAQDQHSGKVTVYRHTASRNSLSDDFVRALFRDREGRLWAGTGDGLDRIDPGTQRVTRFTFDPRNSNTIGPGDITSILEDRRGRIWAGANGGPLNVLQFDRDGSVRIRRLDTASGLPNENVDGLALGARGQIWASTDKGIALIDSDTLRARALGLADGVSDTDYWEGASRALDGTIFFGSANGVTVIAPGAASPWNYAPPLVLTALTIGKRSVPAAGANRGETVELPPGKHFFSAEFAALDYSDPQSLRYAYKLEGFDSDWIAADPHYRIATYTNLPPGRYTLRVRATNRLGVWNKDTLSLRILVLTPWYETWWFRALLTLLGAIVILVIYRWRTVALRQRAHELKTIVDERTRELSRANAALEEQSLSDSLTGLRNRRFLMEHIEDDVALSVRRYKDWLRSGSSEAPHDADLIFFLIDIDQFKAVNDELGHAAGDCVLAQMRERLEQVFRATDYVVRWGGEEFLAIARGSRRRDAADMAERLRAAFANRPFVLESGQTLVKTASIGFAAFPFVPRDPQGVVWSRVVELADRALYMAKRAGRNTWFGLAANERTEVHSLIGLLAVSAEKAVQDGMLDIIQGNRTTAG